MSERPQFLVDSSSVAVHPSLVENIILKVVQLVGGVQGVPSVIGITVLLGHAGRMKKALGLLDDDPVAPVILLPGFLD